MHASVEVRDKVSNLQVRKGGLPALLAVMANGKWQMRNEKFSIDHFPFLIFH